MDGAVYVAFEDEDVGAGALYEYVWFADHGSLGAVIGDGRRYVVA